MKKLLCISMLSLGVMNSQEAISQTIIPVFDTVLYYDGYAATVSAPVQPNVIRHRNDLYATKLTPTQLQSIGSDLSMTVTIKASCDNYDRIGYVNLAFVPKGATTYTTSSVDRIEIARFITPFMNKNLKPDSVLYNYTINNVSSIFREASILSQFDIWVELEVFGVPYAAQTQVAGCSGRNDVFYGSLSFTTNTPPATAENNNVIKPILFHKKFNNYDTTATDTVGKTTKTVSITIDNALTDARLYLITSNHGANTGGEEYNRRTHNAYFDGNLKLTYIPGRTSCEPFRKYNTQGNGIYGPSPRTDAQWQSFSNWCPGDVIDIRRIDLGAVAAGNHSFKIEVPDAVFADAQGNIPVSLYLHGVTSGVLDVKDIENAAHNAVLYPNPANETITVKSIKKISSVTLLNVVGQKVLETANADKIDISKLNNGIFTVHIRFQDNTAATQKIVKQ